MEDTCLFSQTLWLITWGAAGVTLTHITMEGSARIKHRGQRPLHFAFAFQF